MLSSIQICLLYYVLKELVIKKEWEICVCSALLRSPYTKCGPFRISCERGKEGGEGVRLLPPCPLPLPCLLLLPCSLAREVVEYHGQNAVLPLLVVQEEGPSLIGQNWLTQIHLNWKHFLQSMINSCLKICWISTLQCFEMNLELSKMWKWKCM